ncbi:MAG: hypothetical protein COA43_07445 [Robiginitomaculum sp.]|nr:MAG: hypothetical protein COA43_07445 [Robiginitomaculum sp.]
MTDKKHKKNLTVPMSLDEAQPDELLPDDICTFEQDGVSIPHRRSDGYINASALCKLAGREWSTYRKRDATERFLIALEGSLQIRRDLLVQTISTGSNDQRGTWVHPQIAINLGTWISAEFAVLISELIVNWMMGTKVEPQKYPDFNSFSEDEKRMYLRDQVASSNLSLAETAHLSGVITPKDHAIFNSKGYQGMYGGRNVPAIRQTKGLKKTAKILDHMGSAELAANLFRITQTDEKLTKEKVSTKFKANAVHFEVGKRVRQAMIDMSGTPPERLPTAPDVMKLQRQLAKKSIPNPAPVAVVENFTVATTGIEVDLRKELWKYALLVLVQQPNMEMSTTDLIAELPNYIQIPDGAECENESRGDSKFSQIVRNLKSHKTTKTNFIYQGYAVGIPKGFRATEKGRQFVLKVFGSRV